MDLTMLVKGGVKKMHCDFMKAYMKIWAVPFKMTMIVVNQFLYPSKETSIVLKCTKCGGINDEEGISWLFFPHGNYCSRCYEEKVDRFLKEKRLKDDNGSADFVKCTPLPAISKRRKVTEKMKEDFVELNAADFELFKNKCQSWIEFFGLHGWRVFYNFEEIKDCFGDCTCFLSGRVCTIRLNSKIHKDDFAELDLRRTAFHEVLEILFSRIRSINNARYVSDDEMEEEIHNIIRILENKLFPLIEE